MHIALTGTPGTGKTTISTLLQNKHNITTISLNDLALKNQFTIGKDPKRNSHILDLEKINHYINQTYPKTTHPLIFEGHAAHWLPMMDWIIVLRCHPTTLQQRLHQKHWDTHKIKENVEAETIDLILCEAVDLHHSNNIIELNTTTTPPEHTTTTIHTLITNNFSNHTDYCPGSIDWTDILLKNPDP